MAAIVNTSAPLITRTRSGESKISSGSPDLDRLATRCGEYEFPPVGRERLDRANKHPSSNSGAVLEVDRGIDVTLLLVAQDPVPGRVAVFDSWRSTAVGKPGDEPCPSVGDEEGGGKDSEGSGRILQRVHRAFGREVASIQEIKRLGDADHAQERDDRRERADGDEFCEFEELSSLGSRDALLSDTNPDVPRRDAGRDDDKRQQVFGSTYSWEVLWPDASSPAGGAVLSAGRWPVPGPGRTPPTIGSPESTGTALVGPLLTMLLNSVVRDPTTFSALAAGVVPLLGGVSLMRRSVGGNPDALWIRCAPARAPVRPTVRRSLAVLDGGTRAAGGVPGRTRTAHEKWKSRL